MLARVIIDHYHNKLDRLFDYLIPTVLQEKVSAGMRVHVPFGRNNRMLEAFVIEIIKVQTPPDKHKTKEIKELLEMKPVLFESTLAMVNWMKKAYFCRTIEAIRCFVPNQKVNKKLIDVVILNEVMMNKKNKSDDFKAAPAQKRVLDYLAYNGKTDVPTLIKSTGTSRSSIKSLAKKEYIIFEKQALRREPGGDIDIPDYPEPELSEHQKNAIKDIEQTWKENANKHILLHGITGSGKTEIYMQIIKKTLARGKDIILMVPEISLTPQMVQRFKGRFGNRIALLHSHLSDGEKLDEWNRIRSKEADIVIGPRSAVFAPCNNLGMIIIDEEHESTYKSEQSPRYHAVDIAKLRCETEGARLILGSATPSIESYYAGKCGKLKIIELNKRATGGKLPNITTIDLREEAKEGNKTIFSKTLINDLQNCLDNDRQAILFLNRRAYATYVSCMHCGHVIQCDKCDITMKWHKNEKKLKCHYCNDERTAPQQCPECGEDITYQGAGTQKAEDAIQSLFPHKTVVRMDQDTTRKKGAHQKILGQFEKGEIDILIGTQMIAKGLDFPNVTLVGILLADTSINLPDFRASERTFQLVTQVAGRSGRGDDVGKVILQTYQPSHYAIQAASQHDYKRFYEEEIRIRKTFQYPPYSRLLQIIFSGDDAVSVKDTAAKVAAGVRYLLKKSGHEDTSNMILEPGPAIIARIDGKYRHTLLMKSVNVDFSLLKKIVKYLVIDKRDQQIPQNISIVIDPDPRFIQ